MKYSKNCPICRVKIVYKHKISLTRSLKLNRSCRECGIIKMMETIKKKKELLPPVSLKKNCPMCNKKMVYTTKGSLNKSIKLNIACIKCGVTKMLKAKREKKELLPPANLKKNCPICSKEMKYKNKSRLNRSIRKNSSCSSCGMVEANKTRKQTMFFLSPEESKKHKRLNSKRWYRKNIEKIKKNIKKKRKNNPIYRLNESMSSNIYNSLKSNNLSKNGRHWENFVGYTTQELKEHLEKLFQPGMNWKNYGKWHVDHRIPLDFFVYTSTEDVEFKYAWSLLNLQPLWAVENIIKSNKLISSYY